MSQWEEIPGYKFRYRISREGVTQRRLDNGNWRDIQTSLRRGSSRATVTVRCRKEMPNEKEYDILGGFTFRYDS